MQCTIIIDISFSLVLNGILMGIDLNSSLREFSLSRYQPDISLRTEPAGWPIELLPGLRVDNNRVSPERLFHTFIFHDTLYEHM